VIDNLTPAQRSETMRRVRSTNTTPELVVRRMVHGMGFRYGLHCKELPGHPDLVLRRLRAVIFVHGCFWHCHSCEAATLPVTNREYWAGKQQRNSDRDRRNIRVLRAAGWRVLIVWECQMRNLRRLEQRLRRFLSVDV